MWRELVVVVLFTALVWVQGALYDTYTGKPLTPSREARLTRLKLIPLCAQEIRECQVNETRRTDGSCNNLRYPATGAMLTAYSHLLPQVYGPNYSFRPAKSGAPLPLARRVRTAVMSDGRRSSEVFTHLMTHLTVYMTGDITTVHDTANYVLITRSCCSPGGDKNPMCMPVTVPADDLHLRYGPVRCMNLTRSITYQQMTCAPPNTPPERINTIPAMLDLSQVYPWIESNMLRMREWRGGRLRSELLKGKEWPPSEGIVCLRNMRDKGETRCHLSGNPADNSVIGSNIVNLWMFRNHNWIARQLEALNPCWNDARIFQVARDINIAMYQHILYYELWSALLGEKYLLANQVIFQTSGYVDDYDPSLEPKVSLEYTIGSRWFHTVQEGRFNMYSKKGELLGSHPTVDLLLRTGILPLNNTLEGLTQGTFRQPAGDHDYLVDPDMGERVLSSLQVASDVLSYDMMKGRDAGFQPYIAYRRFCHLPEVKGFNDLYYWMPEEQVEALKLNYEDVEDIDLYTAILAEKPMAGSIMGPTLACIITKQLQVWRRADRFWYENSVHPGAFTTHQLAEIRKVQLSWLICEHGDDVEDVQPWPLFVAKPGNELTSCSIIKLVAPKFEAWRDYSCAANNSTNSQGDSLQGSLYGAHNIFV